MQPTSFDPQQALAQLGDDRELLGEIAELFHEDADRMVGDIESAIDLEDANALRNAAHALKGTLANFAATHSRDLSFELETLGREGSLEGVQERFEKLRAAVTVFQEELRSFLAS